MIICDKMIAFVDEARAWLYMSKTSNRRCEEGQQAGLEEGSFEVLLCLQGGYQGLGFFDNSCHK